MKLQAVVFDFDGVIADSEPLHLRALQEALAARGIDLGEHEYYATLLGFNDAEALEVLSRARGLSLDAEAHLSINADKAVRFAALQAANDMLFPGARALIARLGAAVPLAIASGARRDEITRTLTHTGLSSAFTTIVASGETPHSKPAPDPYALAVGPRVGACRGPAHGGDHALLLGRRAAAVRRSRCDGARPDLGPVAGRAFLEQSVRHSAVGIRH
jgi:beta-phosphoglucomutase-like phosphatase (HAD superfamily)